MKQINKLFLGVGLNLLLLSSAYAMDLPKVIAAEIVENTIPVDNEILKIEVITPIKLLNMLSVKLEDIFIENKKLKVDGDKRSVPLMDHLFLSGSDLVAVSKFSIRLKNLKILVKELASKKEQDFTEWHEECEWVSKCLDTIGKIIQPLNQWQDSLNNAVPEYAKAVQEYMDCLYSNQFKLEKTIEAALSVIQRQKECLENIIPGKKIIIQEIDLQELGLKVLIVEHKKASQSKPSSSSSDEKKKEPTVVSEKKNSSSSSSSSSDKNKKEPVKEEPAKETTVVSEKKNSSSSSSSSSDKKKKELVKEEPAKETTVVSEKKNSSSSSSSSSDKKKKELVKEEPAKETTVVSKKNDSSSSSSSSSDKNKKRKIELPAKPLKKRVSSSEDEDKVSIDHLLNAVHSSSSGSDEGKKEPVKEEPLETEVPKVFKKHRSFSFSNFDKKKATSTKPSSTRSLDDDRSVDDDPSLPLDDFILKKTLGSSSSSEEVDSLINLFPRIKDNPKKLEPLEDRLVQIKASSSSSSEEEKKKVELVKKESKPSSSSSSEEEKKKVEPKAQAQTLQQPVQTPAALPPVSALKLSNPDCSIM